MSQVTYKDYELAFIQDQALPESYLEQARRCYLPFAEYLNQTCDQQSTPFFLAINGSQGSGKSTLSLYLKSVLEQYNREVLVLSLDDFYLTRSEREELSQSIHPLLKTRGVPGTHDTQLLKECLSKIKSREEHVKCPRFDKAMDDRSEEPEVIETPCDVLILEGWCWGAKHQALDTLATPVNKLEEIEDSGGKWRTFANQALAQDYEPLYELFDCWAMLKAPSFENVFKWRLEQEEKLAARIGTSTDNKIMSPAEIERFIAHYQRITENTLEQLPGQCDVLWLLDADRQVQKTTSDLPLEAKDLDRS